MERRTVLQLISIGALSPGFDALRANMACQAVHPTLNTEPYKLRRLHGQARLGRLLLQPSPRSSFVAAWESRRSHTWH